MSWEQLLRLGSAAHPVVHAHILSVGEAEAPFCGPCLQEGLCSSNAAAFAEYDECGILVHSQDRGPQIHAGPLHTARVSQVSKVTAQGSDWSVTDQIAFAPSFDTR